MQQTIEKVFCLGEVQEAGETLGHLVLGDGVRVEIGQQG